MPHLSLAVHIADTAIEAAKDSRPRDEAAEAERLLSQHPEADATEGEVAEALAEVRSTAMVRESQGS